MRNGSRPRDARAVGFRSLDGTGLRGRLFGRGVAYNRQGVCGADKRYDCSAGQPDYKTAWKDVVGAVRFVQSQGARRVAIGGASIGGTSSVYAAQSGLIHPSSRSPA